MPVLTEEQIASNSEKAKERTQVATDPLSGKQLECPYCGLTYTPEDGCFCVRVVGWDGNPLGQ